MQPPRPALPPVPPPLSPGQSTFPAFAFWLVARVGSTAEAAPAFDAAAYVRRLARLWQASESSILLTVTGAPTAAPGQWHEHSSERRLDTSAHGTQRSDRAHGAAHEMRRRAAQLRWETHNATTTWLLNLSATIAARSPQVEAAVEASARLLNLSVVMAAGSVVRFVGLADCDECAAGGGTTSSVGADTAAPPSQGDGAPVLTPVVTVALGLGWVLAACLALLGCFLCWWTRASLAARPPPSEPPGAGGAREPAGHASGFVGVAPDPTGPSVDPATHAAPKSTIVHDERLPPQWELEWRRRELQDRLHEREAQLEGVMAAVRALEHDYRQRVAALSRERDEARDALASFADKAIGAARDAKRETGRAQEQATRWEQAHGHAQVELRDSRAQLEYMTRKVVALLEQQREKEAEAEAATAATVEVASQTLSSKIKPVDVATQKSDVISLRPLKLLKASPDENTAARTIQRSVQHKTERQHVERQNTAARTIQRSAVQHRKNKTEHQHAEPPPDPAHGKGGLELSTSACGGATENSSGGSGSNGGGRSGGGACVGGGGSTHAPAKKGQAAPDQNTAARSIQRSVQHKKNRTANACRAATGDTADVAPGPPATHERAPAMADVFETTAAEPAAAPRSSRATPRVVATERPTDVTDLEAVLEAKAAAAAEAKFDATHLEALNQINVPASTDGSVPASTQRVTLPPVRGALGAPPPAPAACSTRAHARAPAPHPEKAPGRSPQKKSARAKLPGVPTAARVAPPPARSQ